MTRYVEVPGAEPATPAEAYLAGLVEGVLSRYESVIVEEVEVAPGGMVTGRLTVAVLDHRLRVTVAEVDPPPGGISVRDHTAAAADIERRLREQREP